METKTITRKSLMRKACPRCGGDVCRTRDTFGVYHQCAQCGREFRRQPAVSLNSGATTPTSVAISAPADSTEHNEALVA